MLNGFGFSGYRSIGDQLIRVAPLKKINLIIGQNNSGKSNLVYFLKDHLSDVMSKVSRPQNTLNFDEHLDRHISKGRVARIRFAWPIENNDESIDAYLNTKIRSGQEAQLLKSYIRRLISSDCFHKESGFIWFEFEAETLNGPYTLSYDREQLSRCLTQREWEQLWCNMTNNISGGEINEWINTVLPRLAPVLPSIPKVEFIPAIRKIGESGTAPEDFSGEGIINRLAKLQNPPLQERELREKFDSIHHFIRDVLENDSATIEIPVAKDMILVHMDGRTLPLSSLGTGIHEVIILAAAAVLLDDTILCIEEPELHLHPLLQRKLVRFLSVSTSNQYVFTTHSAHLLGTNGAEVFHVRHEEGSTTVDGISTDKDKSNICEDLGYKASDILQSNCIIWVEGPSDRILLNHWIGHTDMTLEEGVHYSIMFFGGRLFSHLTAEDELDDFISLRKLNRHTCILFDSDFDSDGGRLKGTKKRLRTEFNRGPGHAWVTGGREIENYINADDYEACIREVHRNVKRITNKGTWSHLWEYQDKQGNDKKADKVKVARHYVENFNANLDVLDLNKQIKKLVNFIYKSNGIE